MRFSLINQALLISLATLALADDNCDAAPNEAPFAPSQYAGPAFPGGNDPETKCDSKWTNGETIIGIEVWSAKFQVKAVRFKFSQSGWGPVRGSLPEVVQAHDVTEWKASDEVGIRLRNNKPDDGDPMDAVGRITITQGGNTIFEVGCDKKKMQSKDITVDNAGGIILGAKTRSGAWLSSIEFKMLKGKVVRTELVGLNVVEDLNKWNEEQKNIDNVNVADVYYKNTNAIGGPNQTYIFTNSESRETSKTITSQRTNQWTAGVTVTVGGEIEIPLVAKVKTDVATKFEYTRQNMDSTAMTTGYKKDLSITQGSGAVGPNMLPPQKAAHCQSWAVSGHFDGDYTGKIEATFSDGSKYLYNDAGSVSSIGWEKASSECKEIDLKDAPNQVSIGSKKTRGLGWFG